MIVFEGLGLPEGPLLLADGSWLVTELAPERGCVTRLDLESGESAVVAHTGRPNGLALNAQGALLVAESRQRAVLELTLDGATRTLAAESDGSGFLWPNDICVGGDNHAYLTDSGVEIEKFLEDGRVPDGWERLSLDGKVCRIDTATGKASTLDEGLQFANGIAFGPDGLLYVSETMTGNVYRYRLRAGRVQGERELFGNVLDPTFTEAGLRGPDGMAFDAEGRLYVTVFGQGTVTVLDRDGGVNRHMPTAGRSPTNVAFGPYGSGTIFVVEDELGVMESIEVGVDGLPLGPALAFRPGGPGTSR